VTLDGSTLDVADTKRNEHAFGRPGSVRGKSGFPQLRFVISSRTGRTCCSVPSSVDTTRERPRWPRRS
jgi:hypothetical protein